ncbi:Rad21/Rec8 N terminal domain protein [Aspergillus bombycis]|uniref:Rad21/Rec8 N terminal domain protein n=1 Tax=Aspergillus bombycis TaxID=109264 RepID=A0A1F7ZL05_9EURO|nr:Rad21/Rec8 N terminal domain protein [Aspergillus bombycis]OGM39725.1 Rad21/Rec8 N terminal domain protein [Aspergillus bombycis]
MFYSHEMLTSPDHGVATIWLVATLGSKSISKKLNRKAILDVDVPRACHVIMDPEAPMALRLQGNLLYGVSRVYSQQCGYALTDVQAMHDKMRTLLKVLPGGGLDPTAGKTRPDQLILPYDPSFLPECDLAGMGMDLSKLSVPFDPATSQHSDLVWPKTPDLSQSALSQSPSLRFSFSYDDIIGKNTGGIDAETNVPSSAQRSINLGGLAATTFAEEGGILLQPDFEFDEDGNLIELGEVHRQIAKGRASRRISEAPLLGEEANIGLNDSTFEYQPMPIDEEIDIAAKYQDERPIQANRATKRRRTDFESTDELNLISDEAAVTMPQRRRALRLQTLDDRTALRNTDLGNLNSDYVRNMAIASKQKRQNKLPTQAKRNAAFWVFGQGIGSVGLGLGASRVPHPLQQFSGEELYGALDPTARHKGRKRSRLHGDDSEADSDVQAVRAREEYEEQVGRGEEADNHDIWQEVEIGRHVPSVFCDDNSFSSQMPWNITASIQSSQHGSSAASGLRGVAHVSDPSASRGRDPTAFHLAGRGRSRNRLTSASPLAGRGIPFAAEAFDSLTLPGNDDMDVLNDFDLSQYLQTELLGDGHGHTGDDANASTYNCQLTLQDRLSKSSLDQESLNFLGFLIKKLEVMPAEYAGEMDEDGFTNSPSAFNGSKAIGFSALLPPAETSPSVATQGLMHILTLATKGFLSVCQEDYEDRSTRYRIRYEFGEIFLQLSDI